jgi:hypothetical protein
MATTYKVLGQSKPTATTDTDLYTVPSSTNTVASTINVVNLNASADTVRIAVRPNGASIADQHYLVYDLALSGKSTFTFTAGITMDAADVVTVYSANGYSAFSIFGSEVA